MNTQQTVVRPLFLVIFLDVLGTVFVFPILPHIFTDISRGILAPQTSQSLRDFWYGSTLALYPIGMLFGAPLLGSLSDVIGRKKVLLLCLLGSCFGYLISGMGITIHNLSLLLFGRLLAGLTAGSQVIAEAAISDVSTDANRGVMMSKIILAVAFGMVLGPIIGGLCSDAAVSQHFSFQMPFWLAALLAAVNLLWLLMIFQETHSARDGQAIEYTKGWRLLLAGFVEQPLRFLVILFALVQLGWLLYYQAITLFLDVVFHYSTLELGLFIGYAGVVACFALTYALKWLLARFSPSQLWPVMLGIILLALIGSTVFSHSIVAQWSFALLLFFAAPILYTLLLALFANAASSEHAGQIMGITGAINAAAFGVSALLAGILVSFALDSIFWVAMLFTLAAFILGLWQYCNKA